MGSRKSFECIDITRNLTEIKDFLYALLADVPFLFCPARAGRVQKTFQISASVYVKHPSTIRTGAA